jgi:hypothetical protein
MEFLVPPSTGKLRPFPRHLRRTFDVRDETGEPVGLSVCPLIGQAHFTKQDRDRQKLVLSNNKS